MSEVLCPAAVRVLPAQAGLLGLLLLDWVPPAPALVLLVLGACWVGAQLCHRWAHRPPGPLVARLQTLGLLVRPKEHREHHQAPFERRLAVITGWSNFLLDALHAPRGLDALMRGLGFRKRGLVHSLRAFPVPE